MEDWIVKGEGTWVLAEGFNTFLGKVFHEEVSRRMVTFNRIIHH